MNSSPLHLKIAPDLYANLSRYLAAKAQDIKTFLDNECRLTVNLEL